MLDGVPKRLGSAATSCRHRTALECGQSCPGQLGRTCRSDAAASPWAPSDKGGSNLPARTCCAPEGGARATPGHHDFNGVDIHPNQQKRRDRAMSALTLRVACSLQANTRYMQAQAARPSTGAPDRFQAIPIHQTPLLFIMRCCRDQRPNLTPPDPLPGQPAESD